MTKALRISRRTALKGLGASIALPWLEAMWPVDAGASFMGGLAGRALPQAAPTRMAWVYVPNGINMAEWTPRQVGGDFELSRILQPLAPVKDKVMVMSGLEAHQADALGDGGGDHARAQSVYLTGAHPLKTDGSNIRAGVSIDQLVASRIGQATRLRSLEIGADTSNAAGSCDTNYSCAYNSNLSWRSATQPQPKTNNPRVVFERLFGSANAPERDRTRRSILDVVMEDTHSLESRLGTRDRQKLEEYLSAVRDIEQRIQRNEQMPPARAPDYAQPAGIPATYEEHLRILSDLLVLAFQTDTTRICTYVFANESSNRPYPWIGVREGHHDLSHHQRNPAKLAKIRDINTFHVAQFAYLLNRLNSINEGDGTLLDHCMIVYGSGNSDGDRHNHDDLPTLFAGKGCGTVSTGRHVRYQRGTPITNLWIAMANRMGANVTTFGDSTGTLTGLEG
jgi:hypothetical protein